MNAHTSDKIYNTIGFPSVLSQEMLPTNGDVIRAFYYTRQLQMTTANKHCIPSFNETIADLISAMISIWAKSSLPHTSETRVTQMIKEQLDS